MQEALKSLPVSLNIFRMMAHSPSYLEQYCRLGGAIRHKGELDPIVRELAITRTGILCEAPYEVVAHKRIGKSVGVTDEQNAALENWQAATCFNETGTPANCFVQTTCEPTQLTENTFTDRKPAFSADGSQIAFQSDRDGDFDHEIVIHEYTHGLSNRLVGAGVVLLFDVEELGRRESHDARSSWPLRGQPRPTSLSTTVIASSQPG